MPEVAVASSQEIALEATVVRCGCSSAQRASPDWHAKRALPCPNPREIESRGIVAYWHRNPLRCFAWRMRRLFRGGGAIKFKGKE